jgi:hypothetical protein
MRTATGTGAAAGLPPVGADADGGVDAVAAVPVRLAAGVAALPAVPVAPDEQAVTTRAVSATARRGRLLRGDRFGTDHLRVVPGR